MKIKHPGILFTLSSIVISFLLGILFALLPWNEVIERSLMCFWTAMAFWWVTYFHVQWIEGKMNKNPTK